MGDLLPHERKKVQKPLLWVGLASITMTFAGLTSGYVVSRSSLVAENAWLELPLPEQFYWATGLIILSSILMVLAVISMKRGQAQASQGFLAGTLVLGLGFALAQWLGWQNLLDRGLFFTGPESNTAISWVYVLSFLHWLHVLAGLLVLSFTLVKSLRGGYSAQNYQGISVAGIFWHFLDGLWIYLFLFLVFIR